MNGTVEALTPDWRGATLVTAVGSVLTVDDVADFDEEGGWLTIADAAPLEYVAVDEDADTVTLTGTAGTVEAGDPVAIWDPTVPPSGAKVVEYLASVMTDRGPVDAVIEHEKIPLAGVDTLVGASVSLTEDTYGTPYVDQVLGREPQIDGAFIDPTSTIPGGQAFSLDAPTATAGYPEDYGWWQVDASGNVLGFWRLVGGVWTTQTIVTAEALEAGNILADAINVTDLTGVNINGTTITGALIRTSATGNRIEVTNSDEVRFYSGNASEIQPGQLRADQSVTSGYGTVVIKGPSFNPDPGAAFVELRSSNALSSGSSLMSTAGRHLFFRQDGSPILTYDSTSNTWSLGTGTAIGSGSVGTGTFRDSVDARANAMSAARMQTGTASSGTVVAATTKTVTVTFPTAFSSAPKVTLTSLNSDPGVDRRVAVVPGSETTTTFQVAFWRATGTASFDTNWLAVKP